MPIDKTSAQISAILAAGGYVALPSGNILRPGDAVPTQAQLDAGLYDSPQPTAYIPRPNARRISLLSANGANSMTANGDSVVATAGGGFTALGINIAGGDPLYHCCQCLSGALANDVAYVSGFALLRAARPFWQGLVRPGAVVTNARAWAGFSSTGFTNLLGVNTPGTSGYSVMAFRYSSALSANWFACTSDGVSQTLTDTGVPCTGSVSRKLEIDYTGGSVLFKIDGAQKAVHSANLPSAAVAYQHGAGISTQEAVAKSISMGWLYGECD